MIVTNGYIEKGMGCLSRDINKGPMVKEGRLATRKCVGSERIELALLIFNKNL